MGSAIVRRVRGAWTAIGRLRRRRLATADRIESRSDLSRRYLKELSELIDDRQISAEIARRVIEDLFEPEEPGRARRVRPAVWRSYLSEGTGQIGPYLVRLDGAELASRPEGQPPV